MIALLAGLLTGCADPKAPEKCEVLLDAICANAADACSTTMTQDECLETVDASFSCDDAIKTSETYDACLELLDEADTCILDDLPADCETAVYALE